jgi:hypothetical protein
MAGENGDLEHRIFGKIAVFPHLGQKPKEAFVQNEEAAKADLHGAKDVGDDVADLIRAAEPQARKGAFGSEELAPGVPARAGDLG